MSEPVSVLEWIFATKSRFFVHLLQAAIVASLKIGKTLIFSHMGRS